MAKKRIVDEEMRFTIVVNGDQGQKELYKLEKATRDLTQENKDYRAEQVRLESQGKKNSKEYKFLSTAIRENNKVIKANKARMNELQKELGVTALTMRQLKQRAKALNLQLYNMGQNSPGRKKLLAELKAINTQMGKLRGQSRAANLSIASVANGFNKYAALGASVLASITGVVVGLQKMIDFNGKLADAQSDVQKTTGLTKKEVDELTKSFGLMHTRTSRINLLRIAEEGGRIGLAKEDISDFVKVMDKAVVALSDSFPGGASEVTAKLGKLKLLFKETKDQKVDEAYNAIGSAINDLGAQGVATETNIANFATRVGSLPDAIKPTIAEALALGAGFEESGIQAEIAGRAYNIFLRQAAEESEKFAVVMGISNQEVKDMINEDALQFMINFAEGLKGMNATDTARTLDFLGINADGANKIFGALSNNTERFRELLQLSNKSMADGVSLVREYNVKNENLQATLEKINRRIRGFIALPFAKRLEKLANWFGKLIGAVKTLDQQLMDQVQTSYENAKANRALANSAQKLLEEYESLTKDGVEPTEKAKKRLEEITFTLKNRLGESVVSVNKETGALILNSNAVRENIKLKRLAADEEAATLASRLLGVIEAQETVNEQLKVEEQQLQIASRLREKATRGIGPGGKSRGKAIDPSLEENKDYIAQLEKTNALRERHNELNTQGAEILTKLRELNFSLEDVHELFAPKDLVAPEIPTSGANDDFTPPGVGAQKRRKSLLEFQQETEDARLAIMGDAFRKELELARVAHERKIAELQSQKRTEGDDAAAINAEINEQIEFANQTHALKNAEILENGLKAEVEKRQRAKQLELQQLEALYNAKLISEEEYQNQKLALEEASLQDTLKMIEAIGKEAGGFRGLDLSILTPEQVAEFERLGDQVIAKLEEIGLKKAKLGKKGNDSDAQADAFVAGGFSNTDFFGFTPEQWAATFDSLDTVNEKLQAAVTVTMALGNAYALYNDFVNTSAERELQDFEALQNDKRDSLRRNLDAGLINERQYNAAVKALDEESELRRAEVAYRQAKREKEMALFNVAMNTASAIIGIWAQVPKFDFGVSAGLLTAFVSTLGAAQAALIAATPLPAKGYEDGFYGKVPVRRTQDGRVFNASYGGKPTSQLVDKPTVFLAGEQGKDFPEMIIDGRAFKRFRPDFKEALYREVARAKGFEGGYYDKVPKTNDNDLLLAAGLARLNELLDKIDQEGILAILPRTMSNARDLSEDIERYKKLRNQNKK